MSPNERTKAHLQAWIDREITPQAVRTAAQLMTDKQLYGFSVLDARTGERVDPATIKGVNSEYANSYILTRATNSQPNKTNQP